MSRLDPLGNKCDFTVRIHVRQVANSQSSVFEQVRNAQRVYGKVGIYFDVGTMESIALDAAAYSRLAVVTTECNWDEDSPEQAELFERVGASPLQQGILAVFVRDIRKPDRFTNGCAGHSPHRAAVVVSAFASPWTLAHEVGHVLLGSSFLPVHTTSRDNVMFSPTSDLHPSVPPGFDLTQQAQIFRSPYVTRS